MASKSLFKVGVAGTFEVIDTDGVAAIELNGSPLAVGAQQPTITDAATDTTLNATYSNTEVAAAINALGTKINAVLAALEANGVLASA